LPIVKLPSVIENALPRFSPIFNKAQLRHFGEYLYPFCEHHLSVRPSNA